MKPLIQSMFELFRVQSIISRTVISQSLGFSEFMVMTFLDQASEGKMRRIDVAKKMGLTASGVTRLLLPMEKIGLITSLESVDDARERYSTLTTAGKRMLDESTEHIEYKLNELLQSPPAEDVKTVIKVLGAVEV